MSSDTLREQVAEAMAVILSGESDWGIPTETDEAWQLADAAIRVVLAAAAERVAALYAEPPVAGAYRGSGGMWFLGSGNDRIGLVGYGPSEAHVLAALAHLEEEHAVPE